jgi:hypothetical protein
LQPIATGLKREDFADVVLQVHVTSEFAPNKSKVSEIELAEEKL